MKKSCVLPACVLALGLICGAVPVSSESDNIFPENLFSSAEVCKEYFVNADGTGTIYEEVDGEYVMTMPVHPGLNYLYTKSPIPYDTFTVTYDFYLIISPDSHFHEMDFLFGMTGGPQPFHQATLTSESGSFYLRHYKFDGAWSEYKEDALFYDVYDEEFWQTFKAEITPEGVSVYLNGEYLATLSNSEGCVGDNGYIGLRGGSPGGWKIKNLKVTEGVSGPTEEPTPGPTAEPTAKVTENPTQTPATETTQVPEQNDETDKNDGSPWLIAGIAAAVVVVGGIVLLILKKKK